MLAPSKLMTINYLLVCLKDMNSSQIHYIFECHNHNGNNQSGKLKLLNGISCSAGSFYWDILKALVVTQCTVLISKQLLFTV